MVCGFVVAVTNHKGNLTMSFEPEWNIAEEESDAYLLGLMEEKEEAESYESRY